MHNLAYKTLELIKRKKEYFSLTSYGQDIINAAAMFKFNHSLNHTILAVYSSSKTKSKPSGYNHKTCKTFQALIKRNIKIKGDNRGQRKHNYDKWKRISI